jgi:tetratricopeptide (TPR) repeat protein
MLFDLRGRRKRAIQAIYLLLAILMGAGLVLFGIGGGTSGGFLDAFTGGGGGGGGNNDAIEKRIDKREQQLSVNPKNELPLRALVRDYYQLAATRIPEGTSAFPQDAAGDLQKASSYWQRYLVIAGDKADPSLAGLAGQLYGPEALNQPDDAQEAYRIIARANNDTNSYLQLVAVATVAGDKRTADLAGLKAVDLAPAKKRKAVEKQIKEIKKQAKAQAAAAAGAAGAASGGS